MLGAVRPNHNRHAAVRHAPSRRPLAADRPLADQGSRGGAGLGRATDVRAEMPRGRSAWWPIW